MLMNMIVGASPRRSYERPANVSSHKDRRRIEGESKEAVQRLEIPFHSLLDYNLSETQVQSLLDAAPMLDMKHTSAA